MYLSRFHKLVELDDHSERQKIERAKVQAARAAEEGRR
jgi:hypothetical protein